MADILVLNGPNLNLLGTREPEIYGADTLESINQTLISAAKDANTSIDFFQSNAESEIITRIHNARLDGTQIFVMNPAAFHWQEASQNAFIQSYKGYEFCSRNKTNHY